MTVVAVDDFSEQNGGLAAPYRHAANVTKSDTDQLADVARALLVNGAGNIAVVTLGGETLTITGVIAGALIPLRVVQVLSTGTTATNIVALW